MFNKKFLMFLAVMVILLFVSVPVFAAKTPKITSKEMPFYFITPENKVTNTVYFIGNSDVPYLSLKDCGEMLTLLMKDIIHEGENINFGLKFSQNGQTGTLTRTDGDPYTMTVDCAADKITFWDYDAFVRPDEGRVLLEVSKLGKNFIPTAFLHTRK